VTHRRCARHRAHSSAVEHSAHNGRVAGSIPAGPTRRQSAVTVDPFGALSCPARTQKHAAGRFNRRRQAGPPRATTRGRRQAPTCQLPRGGEGRSGADLRRPETTLHAADDGGLQLAQCGALERRGTRALRAVRDRLDAHVEHRPLVAGRLQERVDGEPNPVRVRVRTRDGRAAAQVLGQGRAGEAPLDGVIRDGNREAGRSAAGSGKPTSAQASSSGSHASERVAESDATAT
jgi:hypothetical protein